ncbi:unnamed protein product [Gongylonema pulchrum]|uniref:DB domain-containing protein n=1 Tax=Gongylonema pulchrum TaxID=637853 RepID=A0A183ER82_9BILA|nr:unnamed protein product [Gongylonema pulchrum]
MFVGTDPCPQSNGRSLLSCAAQDSDHTACCRASGVQLTAAGNKCLGFCQMSPGSEFQVNSVISTFTHTSAVRLKHNCTPVGKQDLIGGTGCPAQ